MQTGLGRTGTFFAFEQWDVEPDLVTVAKALSGGYVPVGAVIAKSEIVEAVFDKMDRAVVHSSTFGQNVLAMTAGLATLHTLDAESIVAHAAATGNALIARLQQLAERHEMVHEVRGRGFMIGIEFRRPKSMRLRAQWSLLESMRTGLFTQLVIVPLFRDHRILTQVAGDHQNVLKILPPLITTDEQADSRSSMRSTPCSTASNDRSGSWSVSAATSRCRRCAQGDTPAMIVLPPDPVASVDEYLAAGGGDAIERARTLGRDGTIAELTRSGLRGRGGAGFPTGTKWRTVQQAAGRHKYAVVNGAEGEPGTFKDRAILRANPYQVVEGLAIAAFALDARRCSSR